MNKIKTAALGSQKGDWAWLLRGAYIWSMCLYVLTASTPSIELETPAASCPAASPWWKRRRCWAAGERVNPIRLMFRHPSPDHHQSTIHWMTHEPRLSCRRIIISNIYMYSKLLIAWIMFIITAVVVWPCLMLSWNFGIYDCRYWWRRIIVPWDMVLQHSAGRLPMPDSHVYATYQFITAISGWGSRWRRYLQLVMVMVN